MTYGTNDDLVKDVVIECNEEEARPCEEVAVEREKLVVRSVLDDRIHILDDIREAGVPTS